MLKQISIFAENKKGVMNDITGLLADAGINILGHVTNDSAEYGIVRMVVDDADKAVSLLKGSGYACRLTDVLGIEMNDEPGAMNKVLKAISDACVNIDYLYISFNRKSACPVLILHTEDIGEVEEMLRSRGFKTVSREDIK